MLKISVNEDVVCFERGDINPEETLAELQVACESVLKDVSKWAKQPYGELVELFKSTI